MLRGSSFAWSITEGTTQPSNGKGLGERKRKQNALSVCYFYAIYIEFRDTRSVHEIMERFARHADSSIVSEYSSSSTTSL